ncbi:hypothetical protein PG997_010687 [Apiospora hydei]|uniref:Uncharacterized protein n=1 Tax=Apiospora hydei TaxID=1337664 RepID=A0ABR1VGW7_9PEZI
MGVWSLRNNSLGSHQSLGGLILVDETVFSLALKTIFAPQECSPLNPSLIWVLLAATRVFGSMDILRNYSSFEYERASKSDRFTDEPCDQLYLYSAAHTDGEVFEPTYVESNEHNLAKLLKETRKARKALGRPSASLELVFLPVNKKKKKGFGLKKDEFKRLFEDLGLDESLLGFLVSSRSGWYHVDNGNRRYSFLYKDYMYSLAWSFNAETMETRALVSERSDWKKHSWLKKPKQNQPDEEKKDFDFYLPGLKPLHLYHPLTLAFFGLVDATCYLDGVIITDGYSLGDIELMTKHGAWARKKEELNLKAPKETENDKTHRPKNADKRQEDCRRQDTLIEASKAGQQEEAEESKKEVAALSRASRRIAEAVKEAVNASEHQEYGSAVVLNVEQERQEHIIRQFTLMAESMRGAVKLLRARIHTVNESALSTQKRAKAQANVVSGLIAREDTRIGHTLADRARRDGSTMKVIALMTMAFLPATFFAALWSIPVLEEPGLTKDNFWVYWAFTVPTTIVIFFVWDWLNDKNLWELKKIETYQKAYHAFLKKFQKSNDTRASDGVKNSGAEDHVMEPARNYTHSNLALGGRNSPGREADLEKGGEGDRTSAHSPYPRNASPQD